MLRAEPDAATLADQKRGLARSWVEVVLVAAALLLLLTSYRDVVAGRSWFITATLVVAVVTLAVVVLKLIGLRRLTTPLAVLLELVVLGWVFAPQTLVEVVIPTPDTARELARFVDRSGTIILNEQAPVAASEPIVFTIAAAFGALVVLAELLLRARWAVGLIGFLLLCVYVTPAMITGSTASPWLFVAVAAIWLLLLRERSAIGSPTRRARQVPAALIGVCGLAAAVAAPSVLPDISAVAARWGHAPPQVFGRGINPMIELGTNLRRNTPVQVLSYTTELDDPPYLKVATLTDFTGKTWQPDDDYRFARFEGRLQVNNGIKIEERATKISIDNLRSSLLPVPYPATQVEDFDGRIRWERTGQTVESVDGDSRNKSYTVSSLQITPTADQLRELPHEVPYDIRPFTEVNVPAGSVDAASSIRTTAQEITAGLTTDYDKVKALQDYLRSSGGFQYSEIAPVRDDYDGTGLDVVAEFLDKKSGYCVHFSSAMAVMARTLGIPSRIAVGYTPGERGRFEAEKPVYTVMSDNLHAWTEIWFNGAGWVRFDPTTGIGEATSLEESQAPNSSDSSEDSTDSTTTSRDNGDVEENLDSTSAVTGAEQDDPVGRSAIAVSVAALLVLMLPWTVRALRRRWRLRGAGTADPPWREVEDTARDLGMDVPRTQTARTFAQHLSARPGVDGEALTRLRALVEQSRYSRADADASAAAADGAIVVHSLLAGASRAERWRARLLPRSLTAAGRSTQSVSPVSAEPA